MRKRKIKTRTRYLKPRNAVPEEADQFPRPEEWHEDPINGCGETQESK